MEPDHEMIAGRLSDLAGQCGPLRTGEQLLRRVRRRRRIHATGAVFACAGLIAVIAGAGVLLSGQPPRGSVTVIGPGQPPAYCGAPRLLTPVAPDPRASAPPDQPVLDNAASKIDAIGGGGKDVTHGWKQPGSFARWYGGVEISTQWRKVIVYRVPHPELDAAICRAVHDVTVEFAYAAQSAVAANRLASQIIAGTGFGHRPGFQVFSVDIRLDGRVVVGVDHPGAARKALARYGPYILVTKSSPGRPLAELTVTAGRIRAAPD